MITYVVIEEDRCQVVGARYRSSTRLSAAGTEVVALGSQQRGDDEIVQGWWSDCPPRAS